MTTMVELGVELDLPAAAVYDSAAHKRYANNLIRSSIGRSAETDPIAFFCECGASACLQTVWLTRRQYDDCRDGSRTMLLATGHDA